MIRRLAKRVLRRVRRSDDPTAHPAATPAGPRAGATPPPDDSVADAEIFARIDAGAQEIVERVGAGEPVVMVDVRTADEAAAGRIPGARQIPLAELDARWQEVRDCDEIVCFSGTGVRSRDAARLLRERGLFNATSLEGGLVAWREYGGGVSVDP